MDLVAIHSGRDGFADRGVVAASVSGNHDGVIVSRQQTLAGDASAGDQHGQEQGRDHDGRHPDRR